MGVRHTELEIEGIQFHPESIASEFGKKLIANFLSYKREPFRTSVLLSRVMEKNDLSLGEARGFMQELTGGKMADVTINCVNIEGTEMACILATKPDGVIYFFSMATSFTRAALGAEGIGYDQTMIIGNGYAEDHAEKSLQIIRESEKLRNIFEELYS